MSPSKPLVRALLFFGVLSLCACGAKTGVREPRPLDVDAFVVRPDAGMDAGHDGGTDAFVVDVGTDAFVPVPDAFALDAGDPCLADDVPLTGRICERVLEPDSATLSCPGGFVDVVAQGPGMLRWECDGRRAEAVFAAGVYRGTRTGESFALCIRTEFDYVDGCRWQSNQRIEGRPAAGSMSLSYTESAIVSDGDCFPPCTADARITVP